MIYIPTIILSITLVIVGLYFIYAAMAPSKRANPALQYTRTQELIYRVGTFLVRWRIKHMV